MSVLRKQLVKILDFTRINFYKCPKKFFLWKTLEKVGVLDKGFDEGWDAKLFKNAVNIPLVKICFRLVPLSSSHHGVALTCRCPHAIHVPDDGQGLCWDHCLLFQP